MIDSEQAADAAGASLNNYVKLFKKLINIEGKTEEQISKLKASLKTIHNSMNKFFKEHVESKITGELSLELIMEILVFIKQVQEEQCFANYDVEEDLEKFFITTPDWITGVTPIKYFLFVKKMKIKLNC